jgi:hypothetical protein
MELEHPHSAQNLQADSRSSCRRKPESSAFENAEALGPGFRRDDGDFGFPQVWSQDSRKFKPSRAEALRASNEKDSAMGCRCGLPVPRPQFSLVAVNLRTIGCPVCATDRLPTPIFALKEPRYALESAMISVIGALRGSGYRWR